MSQLRLTFDLEADGLLDTVTTVHCLVAQDIDNAVIYKFGPSEIEEGLELLSSAGTLIAHNGIGYDLPALEKLYGFKYDGIVVDTLVMSRLANPNRPMAKDCPTSYINSDGKRKNIGPHTLKSLGYWAGTFKQEFGESSDWTTYTPAMLEYCVGDVLATTAVYHMLTKELRGFSEYSIRLEHDVAEVINQQMVNGWTFDYERGNKLHGELVTMRLELEDEVHKTFLPMPSFIRVVQPRVKKDGCMSSVGLKSLWSDWNDLVVIPEYEDKEVSKEDDLFGGIITNTERIYHSGSFSSIEWPEFNLGSRAQIAAQLMFRGWKPTEYTEKGNVIVNDEVLGGLSGFAEAELIARFFKVQKIEAMVISWITNVDSNGSIGPHGDKRIHGYVNSLGAVTRRMTHSSPNLAQVPASKFDKEGQAIFGILGGYGADCRSLFTVPTGYTLVGCDASGLELRCLAHYMNDATYTDLILNGDIHTFNQHAAGLPTRNGAKTFIYAFLYGAGDGKIGSIIDGGAKQGKAIKAKFLKGLPALKKLKENVDKAAGRGYLKTIDGGRVRVRHAHAALNSLLQSCGAIIMKVWLVEVVKLCGHLDYKAVGNIHDEGQFQVLNKDVAEFSEICEKAFETVTTILKFRCPLAGEAKQGLTWCDTH
jgi:DNA polymerase I-like protein with 3'-5' exonuclease and polymerase domains